VRMAAGHQQTESSAPDLPGGVPAMGFSSRLARTGEWLVHQQQHHPWWGLPTSCYSDEGFLSVSNTRVLAQHSLSTAGLSQPVMICQYWLGDALLLVRWWPHAGWMMISCSLAAGYSSAWCLEKKQCRIHWEVSHDYGRITQIARSQCVCASRLLIENPDTVNRL
jgi:hypothetical protein